MLKIKHTTHLDFPHLTFNAPALQLSPIADEGDELTQAIDADPQLHDDDWQLTDRPDEHGLEDFWNHVQSDIENDPEWEKFDS
mgnify:CR=1 FL=1